ncbi:MAG: RSP_2648 family PIN domain-containing protein [Paracoccaceae bacterium]
MKLVLDACVLYPTVMREVLLGAAGVGFFTPVWSERLLEEWARAARKLGPEGEAQARAEVAMTRAAWPEAEQAAAAGLEARLWLPDPADVHVLAVAIASSADGIVTVNAKDFPRNVLAEEGVVRMDPDGLLHGFWQADADRMQAVGQAVLAQANQFSDWTMRALMKKARLPRLGKALEQGLDPI